MNLSTLMQTPGLNPDDERAAQIAALQSMPAAGYDGSPDANPNFSPSPALLSKAGLNADDDLNAPAAPAMGTGLMDLPGPTSKANSVIAAVPPVAPEQPQSAPTLSDMISRMSAQQGQAQDEAAKNQLVTNIAHAWASGMGQATGARPDEALWQQINAQAQLPLTNVKSQMERAKNAVEFQKELNAQDPTSDLGKGVSSALGSVIDKLTGLTDEQKADLKTKVSKMPPAEALKVLPTFAQTYGHDVTALDAQGRLAQSAQTHEDMMNLGQQRLGVQQQNADTRQNAAGSKVATDQDKSYTQLRKDLETFRGNQVAKQAALDTYSASKALGLVANKDPNSLTQQDLSLLSEELAKIATGGVPGEHGVQNLMPNNLQTKYAEFKNFISSNPTPSQAGAYIQHNMAYLKEMTGAAQNVLNNFRGNILKGYKNRVRAEDYQEVQSDYGLVPPSAGSPVNTPQGAGPTPSPTPPALNDVQAEMKRRGLLK